MNPTTATEPRQARLGGAFPALTGLRAVASLMVVATHAAFWTGNYGEDTIGLFWARLDFGVALFFALSGFLLFRPWISRLVDQGDDPDVARYAWNRVLRIMPAYWIVVVVAFATVSSPNGSGLGGFLRALTLTHIYGDNHIHNGVTQTWSLATEAMFYLVLPALGWFIVKVVCRGAWHPARILTVLGGLCLINFGYYFMVYQTDGFSASSRMWLPAFLTWFAAGMALAVIVAMARSSAGRPAALLDTAAASPVACWLAALCLLGLAATPIAGVASLYQESAGTAIARNLLYGGAALLMILPLVTDTSNVMQRVLASPVMQWLGKISYELFLVHVLLLQAAMNLLGFQTFSGSMLSAFLVTLALSIPASWALYRLLEVPLARFHR